MTDLNANEESTPIIIRAREVLRRTGYSKSTLRRKVEKGLFPNPVDLSGDGSRSIIGWFETEVTNHLRSLPRIQYNSESDAADSQEGGNDARAVR